MDLSTITTADFKALFVRDFTYGSTTDTIMDSDITRAFGEASVLLNQGLYASDDIIELTYLYLTAHYLCLDLRAASSNVESSGFFPVASRSVGSVSESYAIPEAYAGNPALSIYTQTAYGMKFLSLTLPCLVGNVIAVGGATNP
jgi:hypothetical protein